MNHNENSEKMNQITMLGTGNATVSQIYNTCFLLKTPSTLMLVDAGGGNGILAQLKKVNVQISDIRDLGNPYGGTMQWLRGIAACVWKRQGDEGDQDHHRHDSCQEATG